MFVFAPRRVLVYDKCGSAAPRRRQAHAVKRARRAENESEAESHAEPLRRPSAFSLPRGFPSSRLLHFHSGDHACRAWQQLAFGSVFCSCHKRVIRTALCRAELFQECFVCSCHNTSARCLSWAHCRIVLSKKSKRTEILAEISDI